MTDSAPWTVFTAAFAEQMKEWQSPAVTIQRRGTLGLNRAAYVALGAPNAVELLFDREAKKIGLRAIGRTAENAYVVRVNGYGGSSFFVSATGLLKYLGVDTDVAQRFDAVLEGDILAIDLGQEAQLVPRHRSSAPC